MERTDDQHINKILKSDRPGFDVEASWNDIEAKLEKQKTKKSALLKKLEFKSISYWLAAAAMIAVVLSFGLEKWSNYYLEESPQHMSTDSIIDSSVVNVDTFNIRWE